jgi:DMSO/TMAO reductase YedYZ molybdopterin-dependent catalytic subunit
MKISRRKLIGTGIGAAAGASGLAIGAHLAQRHGLIAPDSAGFYGPGETLNYAAERVLGKHSLAREFDRSKISNPPFANETRSMNAEYKRLQAGGFVDWRLGVDGLVARPGALSIAELKKFPSRSQITHMACEEGWSYIAEWIGTPLSCVLDQAGVHPEAKYVVYTSIDREWWDSIDMAEAMHPQTLIAYGMNGGELPPGNGGPLRLRVPRQLGYKNVKYITRLTLTDDLKKFGKGLGSASPEGGYAWYAGI